MTGPPVGASAPPDEAPAPRTTDAPLAAPASPATPEPASPSPAAPASSSTAAPASSSTTPASSSTAAPASPSPATPDSPLTAEPASPPPPASPASPAPTEQSSNSSSRVRFDLDDLSHFGLGIGVGARLDARNFGDPAGDATSHGRVTERSGMGDLRLRFVGYDEQPSRSGKFLWFVLPDIHQSFMFGGTVARQDAAALANDHPIRRKGGFAGLFGAVGGTAGLASKGRVGAYGKGSLTMIYLIGGTTEGAYITAPLGIGAGLRVAPRPGVAILLGPKIDGVLGAHAIAGPRLVLQLAPGADLAIQAEIGYRAYLALGGSVDVTAVGQAHGGQRLLGRGSLDLVFPLKSDLRLSFFLMYRGLRVAGAPGAAQFPAEGMTLMHQVMLFGVGLGS